MSKDNNVDDWKGGCIGIAIVLVVIGIVGIIRLVSTPSGWGF